MFAIYKARSICVKVTKPRNMFNEKSKYTLFSISNAFFNSVSVLPNF